MLMHFFLSYVRIKQIILQIVKSSIIPKFSSKKYKKRKKVRYPIVRNEYRTIYFGGAGISNRNVGRNDLESILGVG